LKKERTEGIEEGIEKGIEDVVLPKTIEMILSLFDNGSQVKILSNLPR
jgi:hypothetical protein